jgi:glutamate-1-semialdehyde-2,1-aminomutase
MLKLIGGAGMQGNPFQQSLDLYDRAREVIPGGVPGIRAPENFIEGSYPIFLDGGVGAWITDPDGHRYLDMLLGYGPIILGHACERVDRAASDKACEGFCLNLPQPVLVELAEQLVGMVPCAEQALFFKTGSDATSAAIRLARAHTGRDKVLRCGYHGWHDWCLAGDPGVPRAVTDSILEFRYNDADQLADLLRDHAHEVAAVILTPVGHDFDAQIETPLPEFLGAVRRLADEHEAVLIFDEVRTGFRLAIGGAQEVYGVTPDLTALGKAMSNGYPISALVGRRDIMSATGSTFISSTYFPNGLSMAAALATLQTLQSQPVLDCIDGIGRELAAELEAVVSETGIPVTLSPYPQMPFLYFDRSLESDQDARRDRFYAELARRGVFAHPRHHGFLSWKHDRDEIDYLLDAVREAARDI